ncbi:MAG: hypothetical protein ABWY82_13645 [Tardiphaga sp.]
MPDNIAVFATVILLLPMIYLFLAAPAFLLVRLDIPPVALLMRTMFSGYFIIMVITAGVGALAVALEGRLLVALGIGLIAALAAASRRWFLRRLDAGLGDRDSGRLPAAGLLRRLHWGGMLSNAALLAGVITSIPYVAVVPR